MRVIIISDFGEINGGLHQVAIAGARGLADRNIDVVYVSAVGKISPLLDHPHIRTIALNMSDVWTERNPIRAAYHGIWNDAAFRAVTPILRDLATSQTVVHVHQWTKALSPSLFAAINAAKLPFVITMHDFFIACPVGHYYVHRHQRPCVLRPLSLACLTKLCDSHSPAHKTVRVLRQHALARVILRARSANLIHISRFERDVVAPFLPTAFCEFLLENPCFVERMAPVPVAANEDFVYIGRFAPEKGPDLYAAAAREAGISAVFMGSGPLEARIRALNPDARVLPWGSREAVLDLLARARALVFPSRCYETSGLVVCEALARGVPVVAARLTGAADRIDDGVTGLLIDPFTPATITAALRTLADGAFAQRLGAEAFERYWRDPLTIDRHVEGLLGVYSTILASICKPGRTP